MLKRSILGVMLAAVLVGAGYWLGQSRPPEVARASIWADSCIWYAETVYLSGGTAKRIVGYAADWDSFGNEWEAVSDSAAKSAIDSFDCERRY